MIKRRNKRNNITKVGSKVQKVLSASQFMDFLGSEISLFPRDSFKANSPMEVLDLDTCSIQEMTAAKKDMYFIVNPGGTKQTQITRLVANYIDLDAGRNKDGQYFDMRTVSRKKAAMLKRIFEFPLKPSAVVETRNGYQVYWKLISENVKQQLTSGASNLSTWNKIQKSIYSFFHSVGADAKTLKVNQIMRLPFTTWYKQYEKKRPFDVKLNTISNLSYTLSEMWESVKDIPWVNQKQWNKYSPPDSWKDKAKNQPARQVQANYTAGNQVGMGNAIADTVAFLNEISGQIKFKGMAFSASVAAMLAERLTKEYL